MAFARGTRPGLYEIVAPTGARGHESPRPARAIGYAAAMSPPEESDFNTQVEEGGSPHAPVVLNWTAGPK